MATWATIEDLYQRYGGEFMDKLATRRDFDEDIEDYVANETEQRRQEVIQLALDDAKDRLLFKINCCFNISGGILESLSFSVIRPWHIKMTIMILKEGGDCKACEDCESSFEEFCKCNSICSDDGTCLKKRGSKISVSKEKFKCDNIFHDGCCKC